MALDVTGGKNLLPPDILLALGVGNIVQFLLPKLSSRHKNISDLFNQIGIAEKYAVNIVQTGFIRIERCAVKIFLKAEIVQFFQPAGQVVSGIAGGVTGYQQVLRILFLDYFPGNFLQGQIILRRQHPLRLHHQHPFINPAAEIFDRAVDMQTPYIFFQSTRLPVGG